MPLDSLIYKGYRVVLHIKPCTIAFLCLICYYSEWKISPFKEKGGKTVRTRKQALGSRNIVGAKIEERRKAIGMKQKDLLAQLQVNGIELNASGLSKIEGQIRNVSDIELKAFSKILGVSSDEMLGLK